MGFAEELQSEAFKQQVKQQVKLLKRRNGLKVTKHVDGRAAMLEFVYDGEFFGQVVVKGAKYRIFKEIGGFANLDDEELLEAEPDDMRTPEPEKKEVVADGKDGKSAESEKTD